MDEVHAAGSSNARTGGMSPSSPADWDVDVVLTSGRVGRVRSIHPHDADGIRDLHARLSPETRLLRFFTPMPTLPEPLLHRFVNVDHHDRVALVVELDDQIIAVGRYDRSVQDPSEAEVAFVVDDRFQGEGIGSLLLEHLAVIALDHDITKFVAETLAGNDAMLHVFASAGFEVQRRLSGGIFDVSFPIEPTDQSDEIRERRDHVATVRSITRLLRPAAMALIGDGAERLRTDGDASAFAGRLLSIPRAVWSVTEAGDVGQDDDELDVEVDLAIVDVAPDDLTSAITWCATNGIGVAVVMSGIGRPDEARRLTRFARSHGMRILGPNSLGVANTDPSIALHLFSDNLVPPNHERLVLSPGTVGVFTHSPELTRDVLQAITDRKLGISTAVSAGDKADISGNDLLEYWEDDDSTDVVVFGVESFGNPRRFARLAERITRRKPLIILGPDTPETAALCRRTGIVRADTVSAMAQTASVFALHPEWFHPPAENDVVMPDVGTDITQRAAAALASATPGPLTDDELDAVLRAVGLDGWSGPVGDHSVVGRQDPRYGPLVEIHRDDDVAVALAPLTQADLDGFADASPALLDVLMRLGAAMAEFPDLAEMRIDLTRYDTPAAVTARVSPNPNGVDQVVRYLS